MTTTNQRIAIVEDHELLAQSLAFALRADGFAVDVIIPTSHEHVLDSVRDVEAAIVLLDLSLGTLGSGVPLIPELRKRGAEVICVTGETSRALWGACIEAGAVSVMSKSLAFEELLTRIGAVAAGEAAISVTEREALLYATRQHRASERDRLEPFERLTTREREVLQGLVNGSNAEEIATASYVSLTTVRTQIRAIFSKLEVGSQLAAVALAVRSNWMRPPAE